MQLAKRDYFDQEAYVARTPSHPGHLNPDFPPGARVVCVGCGGGWEGERTGAGQFVAVDIDHDAAEYRAARGADVAFSLARAEALPFASGAFTFYVARVSLMYTDLGASLAEAARVLAPDGEVWFTCHDLQHAAAHLGQSLAGFHLKDIVYRSYVLVNGLLYDWFGTLVSLPVGRSRMESFQTRRGVRQGLVKAGFSDIVFPDTAHGHFLVRARKRAEPAG